VITPTSRPPGDGDYLEPTILEIPECRKGAGGNLSSGGKSVVKVKENALKVLKSFKRYVFDGSNIVMHGCEWSYPYPNL
jgi:hypothetical protein